MTESSPGDLAVAFRSFARRVREAAAPAEGDEALRQAVEPLLARVTTLLEQAAAVVGAFPGNDVARTGAAIADHIEAVRAEDWDGERLDRLRHLAVEIGATIRNVEELARG
jgi:hypothetical protein